MPVPVVIRQPVVVPQRSLVLTRPVVLTLVRVLQLITLVRVVIAPLERKPLPLPVATLILERWDALQDIL